MSTMTRSNAETSVTFSLAELAKIEEERVREEEIQRSRSRERDASQRREAEARRRAAEEAQIAAEVEARARRVREEAVEKARVEARERAAMDVARIEAEARARLEMSNAERAHELAVIRARTEGGRRRLQTALAVALGLVLCAGGVGAAQVSRHVTALEQDTEQLREGQRALGQERDLARTTELAALDRRLSLLAGRPLASGALEARATAEAARHAVDEKALDHDRLRAFSDAIDVLEGRIQTLEKLAALDRRRDDLAAWAADRKKGEAMADARGAGAKARAMGTDESLHLYEAALDKARSELAQVTGGGGGRPPIAHEEVKGAPCAPGDPSCDINGKRLF